MKPKDANALLKNIGSLVRRLRKEEGISQLDLGNHVDLSANQIGRIERAEGNPTVKTLFAIANHYNMDIKTFFEAPEESHN